MKRSAKRSPAKQSQPDKVFFIRFMWGSRKESVELCAKRVGQFLRELTSIDAAFRPWEVFLPGRETENLRYMALGGQFVPLARKELIKWLLKGRNRTDTYIGGPPRRVIDELGFQLHLVASRSDLNIHCGCYGSHVGNIGMIGLPSIGKVAGRVLRLPLLLRVMKAVVKHWQPDIGIVTSTKCFEQFERSQQGGWVTFVSNEFRKDLPVPQSAKVLKVKGGRFIIASRGRFSSGNLKHMKVVGELYRSLNEA